MKKTIILLFLVAGFAFSGIAKSTLCNFTLELGEGIVMGETYELRSIKFEGLEYKLQKKAMGKLNFQGLFKSKISLEYFQENLVSIARIKKSEIYKVVVTAEEGGFLLTLHYNAIVKETKSKG